MRLLPVRKCLFSAKSQCGCRQGHCHRVKIQRRSMWVSQAVAREQATEGYQLGNAESGPVAFQGELSRALQPHQGWLQCIWPHLENQVVTSFKHQLQARYYLEPHCPKMQANMTERHGTMWRKPVVCDAGKHGPLMSQCCQHAGVHISTVPFGQGDGMGSSMLISFGSTLDFPRPQARGTAGTEMYPVKEALHQYVVVCIHQAGQHLHQVTERLVEHTCRQLFRSSTYFEALIFGSCTTEGCLQGGGGAHLHHCRSADPWQGLLLPRMQLSCHACRTSGKAPAGTALGQHPAAGIILVPSSAYTSNVLLWVSTMSWLSKHTYTSSQALAALSKPHGLSTLTSEY